jgi:hypothetical protein
MQAERPPPLVANMSAPPRSWVRWPRLGVATGGNAASTPQASGAIKGDPPPEARTIAATSRPIPVGPGGGLALSHALRLTQIDLPCAVHAALRLPMSDELLVGPLGMARALVALARRPAPGVPAPASWRQRIRRDIQELGALPEGALLDELCARLAATAWPAWVPLAAIAIPLGMDATTRLGARAPAPPPGVGEPLLVARLVSAIRGPAFLRDAPPTLSNLLEAWRGPVGSGCWDLWLPVRPGLAHAVRGDEPRPRGQR